MLFATPEETWRLTPPPSIRRVNPIGSGDAFAGAYAVGLSCRQPPIDAARVAVAAGTANALTLRGAFVDRAQIENLSEDVIVDADE